MKHPGETGAKRTSMRALAPKIRRSMLREESNEAISPKGPGDNTSKVTLYIYTAL
jgi:hypothetical protein